MLKYFIVFIILISSVFSSNIDELYVDNIYNLLKKQLPLKMRDSVVFVRFGEGKYDWLAVTLDKTLAAKLEGMNSDGTFRYTILGDLKKYNLDIVIENGYAYFKTINPENVTIKKHINLDDYLFKFYPMRCYVEQADMHSSESEYSLSSNISFSYSSSSNGYSSLSSENISSNDSSSSNNSSIVSSEYSSIDYNSSTSSSVGEISDRCKSGYSGDPYEGDINCSDRGLKELGKGWLNLYGVEGSLYLDRNFLKDVDNLSNLEFVDGDLYLNGNILNNIEGLGNLNSVKVLDISNNDTLDDLYPLVNINYIEGLHVDNRDYSGKLPFNSYICLNFSKIGIDVAYEYICEEPPPGVPRN